MAHVLCQSTPPPFDHLIRLYQKGFPIPGPPPPSVKLIVFEDMNSIPELLLSHATTHQFGVDDNAALHTNSEPSDMTSAGHTSAADGIDRLGEIPNGNQRAEAITEYAAQDTDDADDGEEPDRTKEVKIIQRAARLHFFKDAEEQPTDALTRRRNRLFKTCKASANSLHAKYRKVYLGPVPHLLLCVEWIVTRAQESKDAIKARRVDATLQEKSDLIAQHKQMR